MVCGILSSSATAQERKFQRAEDAARFMEASRQVTPGPNRAFTTPPSTGAKAPAVAPEKVPITGRLINTVKDGQA